MKIQLWQILSIISIAFLTIFLLTGYAYMKSIGSDFNGGLERTVKVYDYNGNKLAEYKGKIDIQEDENKVFFDLKGKRVVIYNAVVITEEKDLE